MVHTRGVTKRFLAGGMLALAAAVMGCSDDDDINGPPLLEENLVETARAAGSFSTLVTAVEAAGLDQTLATGGPFTVFAPTDAAFEALPEGVLDGLLADSDALSGVLLFHVVEGEVFAADLTDGGSVATLSGGTLSFDLSDEAKVNGVRIAATDILADNGVIHVIADVLLPSDDDADEDGDGDDDGEDDADDESQSIVDVAEAAGTFTTLLTALEAADLDETLDEDGPFTVFAPTDDAFAALPAGALDDLLADPAALANVLLYHVVDGKVLSTDLADGASATTLNGQDVTFDLTSGVRVNDADVIQADVMADNGVIHVIDAVLLPPTN